MKIQCLGLLALSVMVLSGPAEAARININMGESTNVPGWNLLTSRTADVADLLDSQGNSTGVSLITDDTHPFSSGNNHNGTNAPQSPASDLFPASVTVSNWYGHTGSWYGQTCPTIIWTFANLNADTNYTFHFFASRSASENREALYSLAGSTTASAALNASNNNSQYVTVADMLPDSNGQIVLTITKGPNNNNATGFFHLSAMVVDTAEIPEPASLAMLAASGLMLLRRR